MKKACSVTVLFFCVIGVSFAQKQSGPLPYNKERLDSLFGILPKLYKPFILPAPKEHGMLFNIVPENFDGLEAFLPKATIINKTAKGIVLNMPGTNMPVLVPDMAHVERMPGGRTFYKKAPKTKMPNPLYGDALPPKKLKEKN